MNKLCKECKHTEANHPFYDGVGKIKCLQFQKEKHDLNQCANDWIMCTCGKLFGDKKEDLAIDKFTNHLVKNGRIDLAMYYECQIQRTH